MAQSRSVGVDEVAVRLDLERLAEGGYVATSPDVPGLVAQGRTMAETVEIASDVARRIVESCLEHGDQLPKVFANRRRRTVGVTAVVAMPGR